MNPEARIWIYQADKELVESEIDITSKYLSAFTKSWSSHGIGLKAGFEIKYNRFIVLIVDETNKEASGCSIDKSTQAMVELGNLLRIDLLNKTNLAFLNNQNQIFTLKLTDLKTAVENSRVLQNTLFFNNTILKYSDLATQWLVPASDSWLKRYFKVNA